MTNEVSLRAYTKVLDGEVERYMLQAGFRDVSRYRLPVWYVWQEGAPLVTFPDEKSAFIYSVLGKLVTLLDIFPTQRVQIETLVNQHVFVDCQLEKTLTQPNGWYFIQVGSPYIRDPV